MYDLILWSGDEKHVIPELSWEQVMVKMCSSWYAEKLSQYGVTHWQVI